TCNEDSTKENKCSAARCGKISESETLQCPSGQCCNSEGYCGTSENFCYSSKGCQPLYGVCQCGENNDAGTCSSDYCCSKKGYCGTTTAFCAKENCQSGFGKCEENGYTCADVESKFIVNDNSNEIVNCQENEDGYVSKLTIKNKELSNDDLNYIYKLKTLKSL
ncbi:carbohydrate-binding module family 18 protein, partial [Piromyces sp. E2]